MALHRQSFSIYGLLPVLSVALLCACAGGSESTGSGMRGDGNSGKSYAVSATSRAVTGGFALSFQVAGGEAVTKMEAPKDHFTMTRTTFADGSELASWQTVGSLVLENVAVRVDDSVDCELKFQTAPNSCGAASSANTAPVVAAASTDQAAGTTAAAEPLASAFQLTVAEGEYLPDAEGGGQKKMIISLRGQTADLDLVRKVTYRLHPTYAAPAVSTTRVGGFPVRFSTWSESAWVTEGTSIELNSGTILEVGSVTVPAWMRPAAVTDVTQSAPTSE